MSRSNFVVLASLVALVAVIVALLGGPSALFGPPTPDHGAASPGDATPEGASGGARAGDAAAGDAASGDASSRPRTLFGRPRLERKGLGALAGRVVRHETQEPVADATVHVVGTGNGGEAVGLGARTDAAGRFAFADVPAGDDFVVRVEAAALPPSTVPSIAVTAGATTDLGVLYLGEPSAVVGTVVDENGRGLPGARVDVFASAGSMLEMAQDMMAIFATLDREPTALASARTNGDGTFRVEAVTVGSRTVRATHAGRSSVVVRVEVVSGGRTPALTIVVTPGLELAGRVEDEQGRGVSGARLALLPESMDDPMAAFLDRRVVESSPDGSFRLVVPERRPTWRAIVVAEGFARAMTAPMRAPSESERIVLRRAAELEVTVRDDATRAAVVGAQVIVATNESGALSDDRGGFAQATTGADGVAHVQATPGQVQMIVASHPDYAMAMVSPAMAAMPGMTLPGGVEGTLDPEIRADRVNRVALRLARGTVIVGRVSGPDGAPIAGADVRVVAFGLGGSGRSARTDANGDYRIEGAVLVQGNAMVVVRAPGWVQRDLGLGLGSSGVSPKSKPEPGSTEVRRDVTLHPAATVRGRVVDEDGHGIAGARVRADAGGMAMFAQLLGASSAVTGPDGGYVLFDVDAGGTPLGAPPDDAMPAGPSAPSRSAGARLFATAAGYLDGSSSAIQADASGAVAVEPITLRRGATIEGRVLQPGGAPAVGALVEVAPERADSDLLGGLFAGGATERTVLTRADGTFVARALPDGDVVFTATARGAGAVRATVAVAGGKGAADVVLRLRAAGRIAGRVLDPEGRPVRAARVSVEGGPTPGQDPDAAYVPSLSATTDADGKFAIADVPMGTFTVRAYAPDHPAATGRATVGGAEVEIRFAARSAADGARLQSIDREIQEYATKMASAKDDAERRALSQRLMELVQEKSRLSGGGEATDPASD